MIVPAGYGNSFWGFSAAAEVSLASLGLRGCHFGHSATPPLRHHAGTILCQVVPSRARWHVLARVVSATFTHVAE